MAHRTLRELLKPYGLDKPGALALATGFDTMHLYKVLHGHRPVSRKLALRLKELSRGALNLDQIFSASGDGKNTKKSNRKP